MAREVRPNFTATRGTPGSVPAGVPRRNDRNSNPNFTYAALAIKPPGKK